jgi:methyl-accepting chemotaxis protein
VLKWFANLATRNKLLIAFGVIYASLMISVVQAVVALNEMKALQEQVLSVDLPAALNIKILQQNLPALRVYIQTCVLVDDATLLDKQIFEIRRVSAESSKVAQELKRQLAKEASKLASIEQVENFLNGYQDQRLDSLLSTIVKSRGNEEAKANFLRQQRNGFQSMIEVTKSLGDSSEAAIRQQLTSTQKSVADSEMSFLPVAVVSLLLGLSIIFLLSKLIAEPLHELTEAAERIACGDLSVELVGDDRKDEVGALSRAFVTMTRSLEGVASTATDIASGNLTVTHKARSDQDKLGLAFANMHESLAGTISEIRQAVNVLSSTTDQIHSSVTISAAGATQTAAAVSETSATAEEVRQTSQLASQKANLVADSANRCQQISNDGVKATQETVEEMRRIKEQMDLIAASMTELTEKSRSIAEIISTVEELAQQSHVLAVNASIEAAKAQEHGTGFTIVAHEMKSMAVQSKQATAKVRSILDDISKATKSASTFTQTCSQVVDAAMTQSTKAGSSIQQLSTSVSESARAAAQIVVSNKQQLVGVDQVVTAMQGISEATSQHLTAIRQVESAAGDLMDLGSKLQVLLKRYDT